MRQRFRAIWVILRSSNWILIGDTKRYPETIYLPGRLVAKRISKNELYIRQDPPH